ncbi:hypothetical protein ABTM54_19740, partial [Acinetobacter baumannii]
VVACLLEAPAFAADVLDPAVAHLLTDSFPDTGAAIEEIAGSGAPAAGTLLEAMLDRRLFFSASEKAVFYRNAVGELFSAPG